MKKLFKKSLKILENLIFILPVLILPKITDPILKKLKYKFVFVREERLGHQISNIEIELEKAKIYYKEDLIQTIFIFYTPSQEVANLYLRKLILKYLKNKKFRFFLINKNKSLIIKRFIRYLSIIFKKSFYIYFSTTDIGSRQIKEIITISKTHKQTLKKLGINNRYICIYARDENYLSKRFPNINFRYHDYRNSDINNLRLLSEYAVSRFGYDVVRIGSNPKREIKWDNFEGGRIVDYSFSDFKSPRNDIDLIAGCDIYINNGGGPSSIAISSGRNIITINHLPIGRAKKEICQLWIPKLIVRKGTNNYLSFKEIEDMGLSKASRISDYEELGLKVIENTDHDILNIFLDYFKIKENKLSSEEKNLIFEYREKRKMSKYSFINQEENKFSDTLAPSFLKNHPSLL